MDEKNIKEIWRQGRSEADSSWYESNGRPRIPNNRRKTALTRLQDRYKRFIRMEIIFTFAIPGMVSGILRRTGHSPAVIIAFILFFLTAAAIDYHIYRQLREISVDRMTTSEVIRRSTLCRKQHLASIIFLFPFALICVGLLGWALYFDIYFMIGMGVGALVGLAVGIVQFQRFMSDYRRVGLKETRYGGQGTRNEGQIEEDELVSNKSGSMSVLEEKRKEN